MKLVYLLIFLPIFVASAQPEESAPKVEVQTPCTDKVEPYPLSVTAEQAGEILGKYEKLNFFEQTGGPGPQIAKALSYLVKTKHRGIVQAAYNLEIFLNVIKKSAAPDYTNASLLGGPWSFRKYRGSDGSYVFLGDAEGGHPKGVVLRPHNNLVEIYKGKIDLRKYFGNDTNRWPDESSYNDLFKFGDIQVMLGN